MRGVKQTKIEDYRFLSQNDGSFDLIAGLGAKDSYVHRFFADITSTFEGISEKGDKDFKEGTHLACIEIRDFEQSRDFLLKFKIDKKGMLVTEHNMPSVYYIDDYTNSKQCMFGCDDQDAPRSISLLRNMYKVGGEDAYWIYDRRHLSSERPVFVFKTTEGAWFYHPNEDNKDKKEEVYDTEDTRIRLEGLVRKDSNIKKGLNTSNEVIFFTDRYDEVKNLLMGVYGFEEGGPPKSKDGIVETSLSYFKELKIKGGGFFTAKFYTKDDVEPCIQFEYRSPNFGEEEEEITEEEKEERQKKKKLNELLARVVIRPIVEAVYDLVAPVRVTDKNLKEMLLE